MKGSQRISYAFLICLFLFSCRNADNKLNEERPKRSIAFKTELSTTKNYDYYIDTVKFKFSCNDTLDLRYASIKKYDYTRKLTKLTEQDKKLYFQQFYNQFKKSDLYFFAHLKCNSYSESMVFLDVDKTTFRLVETSFKRNGSNYHRSYSINNTDHWQYNIDKFNMSVQYTENLLSDFYKIQRIDTTVSSYKNAIITHEEYLARAPGGYFEYATKIDTKQIGKSVYCIDTLKYYEYINSVILNRNKSKKDYSIRYIIPKGKNIFSKAIGDLNSDGIDDYAFILQDDGDQGESFRDLLIVFTTLKGFKVKTYIKSCFSCKQCGGFFDPIDGTEGSGISIVKGKLIYKYFGGSAWKWEGDLKFVFSTELDDFFLTQERGRGYNSTNIYESESELPYIEKVRNGIKLTKEEQEEYEHARKGLEDYKYRITNYRIGKKSIYVALKSEENY